MRALCPRCARAVRKRPLRMAVHRRRTPDQSDHRGKKRNLQWGNSCWAIFGTQTFGSQTPPPPPPPPLLMLLPWRGAVKCTQSVSPKYELRGSRVSNVSPSSFPGPFGCWLLVDQWAAHGGCICPVYVCQACRRLQGWGAHIAAPQYNGMPGHRANRCWSAPAHGFTGEALAPRTA